jgi:hypothetical protein
MEIRALRAGGDRLVAAASHLFDAAASQARTFSPQKQANGLSL